jgi:hypothetical protein
MKASTTVGASAVVPATTMKASTTVGAATVESTTTIPAEAAACIATTVAASDRAAGRSSPVAVSWPIAIPRSITIAGPRAISRTVVAATIAAIIAAIAAVKPRSGADKDAAYKVLWPVIAIRCAVIRVVAVITVGAYRSGTDICVEGFLSNVERILSNVERILSLCMSSGKKQNPKQRNIL